MLLVVDRKDTNWLNLTLEAVRHIGCAVVTSVLEPGFLLTTREAMYRVQSIIAHEVGKERLRRAGELGVLRLMCKHDRHFLRFLEVPELLAVVDATVSPTAVLHLQNGFILP